MKETNDQRPPTNQCKPDDDWKHPWFDHDCRQSHIPRRTRFRFWIEVFIVHCDSLHSTFLATKRRDPPTLKFTPRRISWRSIVKMLVSAPLTTGLSSNSARGLNFSFTRPSRRERNMAGNRSDV